MDNIPSELSKNEGEATTTVLTAKCQKILEMKEWPKGGDNCSSYLYQRKAMSSNVRTIVPSA